MKRWSWRVFMAVAIAAVVAPVGIPVAQLIGIVYTNFRHRHEITREVRARYPGVAIGVQTEVMDTRIFIYVRGMPQASQRAELRQWLADWKARRGTDARIVLWFGVLFSPEDE